MVAHLFDFAVTTIFAREVLEGSIIIGEYRTIILRGDSLTPGIRREDALYEITMSTVIATACALLVIAATAIPLAILANSFDDTTSKIIEGISKIVAAISLLQLSLKIPKWLGVYGSMKKKKKKKGRQSQDGGLTIRSIRFNVMWNIWREVAECGVFLIPFFLHGEALDTIPLSAVIGFMVGLILGVGLYYGNKLLKNKTGLTIFAVLLLVFLSAGLFTGGCHRLEEAWGSTPQVWALKGDFWSIDRLPMTVFKPFGYNDSRTVLEIVCFWSMLSLAALLHYRKYRLAPRTDISDGCAQENEVEPPKSIVGEEIDTVELGESSLGSGSIRSKSVDG